MNHYVDEVLAQQIVNTVRDVCGCHINFIDCSGIIFASTDEKRLGTFHEIGKQAAITHTMIEVDSDERFAGTQKGVNLPIRYNQEIVAVIGITGKPQEVRKYAHLAERITKLLIREKELNAFSRTLEEKKHFVIRAFITRNMENMDYLKEIMEGWNIPWETEKRMVLVQINSNWHPNNLKMMEPALFHLFQSVGVSLYTYEYPNEYLAVIEEKDFKTHAYLLKRFAEEYREFVKISVGKNGKIYELADSYEAGRMGMKSFSFSKKNYTVYEELTLEVVLSSISAQSKDVYAKRILKGTSQEERDLLNVYFEEDMSLKQTCERLYLHKNTLQYKLDKFAKQTGYNPRRFKDACLIYLALRLEEE